VADDDSGGQQRHVWGRTKAGGERWHCRGLVMMAGQGKTLVVDNDGKGRQRQRQTTTTCKNGQRTTRGADKSGRQETTETLSGNHGCGGGRWWRWTTTMAEDEDSGNRGRRQRQRRTTAAANDDSGGQ
jgi:hypothetical protein